MQALRAAASGVPGSTGYGPAWQAAMASRCAMHEQTLHNPHTRSSLKVCWAYLPSGPSGSGSGHAGGATDHSAAGAASSGQGAGAAAPGQSAWSSGGGAAAAAGSGGVGGGGAEEENARRRRLLDVMLSAVPFVEHIARARAGGQQAQVRGHDPTWLSVIQPFAAGVCVCVVT